MQSVEKRILEMVDRAPEGSVFFAGDFFDLGKPGAIRTALHRLAKRHILLRMAQGIYVKPYLSRLLNKEVPADIDTIVKNIARRDKARLLPSGSYALNKLGLSDQVPLNLVYYTDGKPRKLRIGNYTVTLKRASPKKFAYKGQISRLVILALGEIGKGNVTPQEEKRIIEQLKKEDITDLKHDIKLAPQWIAEIMAKALKDD